MLFIMVFARELLEENDAVEETVEVEAWEATSNDVAAAVDTPKETIVETSHDNVWGRGRNQKWRKWDRDKRDKRPRRQTEGKKEFEEKMLEVRRVTRVTTGGRQLSFRATMLIWNKNGKIGLGIAKWNDVQTAVSKATHDAYKNIVDVSITKDWTVPYPMVKKFRAAMLKLVPAKPGTGLKAWSSVRSVLELAWFTNMLSKIVGTNNILNNALLTIDMISSYKNFSLRFKAKVAEIEKSEEVNEVQ